MRQKCNPTHFEGWECNSSTTRSHIAPARDCRPCQAALPACSVTAAAIASTVISQNSTELEARTSNDSSTAAVAPTETDPGALITQGAVANRHRESKAPVAVGRWCPRTLQLPCRITKKQFFHAAAAVNRSCRGAHRGVAASKEMAVNVAPDRPDQSGSSLSRSHNSSGLASAAKR
mgnify:CR=1 FL=1